MHTSVFQSSPFLNYSLQPMHPGSDSSSAGKQKMSKVRLQGMTETQKAGNITMSSPCLSQLTLKKHQRQLSIQHWPQVHLHHTLQHLRPHPSLLPDPFHQALFLPGLPRINTTWTCPLSLIPTMMHTGIRMVVQVQMTKMTIRLQVARVHQVSVKRMKRKRRMRTGQGMPAFKVRLFMLF